MELSLSYIIGRTIPESIILILSGMILLNKEIKFIEVLKKGLLFALVMGCIRLLPINFGVHTVLGGLILGVILYGMSNREIKESIISTGVIWISMILSEGIYILIATEILKIDSYILVDTQTLMGAIITLPSLIITLSIVILFKKIVVEKVNEIVGE